MIADDRAGNLSAGYYKSYKKHQKSCFSAKALFNHPRENKQLSSELLSLLNPMKSGQGFLWH